MLGSQCSPCCGTCNRIFSGTKHVSVSISGASDWLRHSDVSSSGLTVSPQGKLSQAIYGAELNGTHVLSKVQIDSLYTFWSAQISGLQCPDSVIEVYLYNNASLTPGQQFLRLRVYGPASIGEVAYGANTVFKDVEPQDDPYAWLSCEPFVFRTLPAGLNFTPLLISAREVVRVNYTLDLFCADNEYDGFGEETNGLFLLNTQPLPAAVSRQPVGSTALAGVSHTITSVVYEEGSPSGFVINSIALES